MNINELLRYDTSVNTTGCCPKFDPAGWDDQALHLRDKPFVRAGTRSVMYVPQDMGEVFARVFRHIEQAGASGEDGVLVMSRDLSPTNAEHLFAVSKPVPEEQMTTLSGDFVTKVFEGPYERIGQWRDELAQRVRAHHAVPGDVYFFYTTCPKCAQAYGRNYVVGIAALEPGA
ncbi:hydrolase [Aquabacterium humicola]|uniref:hydrolase n=1 Tax=Aquabacterium humicola TaxID=3237377 RepID=UPI0025436223|nr:hydrolase [Rubrivivax pictus]